MKERRYQERFDLRLPLVVQGEDREGIAFKEKTTSENISSQGSYCILEREVKSDSRFQVMVILPFRGSKRNEINLNGTVLRVDNRSNGRVKTGVAMRFETNENWGL